MKTIGAYKGAALIRLTKEESEALGLPRPSFLSPSGTAGEMVLKKNQDGSIRMDKRGRIRIKKTTLGFFGLAIFDEIQLRLIEPGKISITKKE